jgi:hypothetical protein
LATASAAIEALHREIDAAVRPLEATHADRLRCTRGCSGCCVDGLRVFGVEADLIRRHHVDLLDHGAPHPAGACAFLDRDGACRVYAHRPYVCRTQGLPLRWTDDDAGVEARDICSLNEPGGPDLVQLPSEACWTLGPYEARLASLEAERIGRHPVPSDRVSLRDLFRASACGR